MANNFVTNLRATRSNTSNTANNLNMPVTRGDMQKQRQAQSKVDPNAFINFLRMIICHLPHSSSIIESSTFPILVIIGTTNAFPIQKYLILFGMPLLVQSSSNP